MRKTKGMAGHAGTAGVTKVHDESPVLELDCLVVNIVDSSLVSVKYLVNLQTQDMSGRCSRSSSQSYNDGAIELVLVITCSHSFCATKAWLSHAKGPLG